jgi:hypothetical protein
MAQSGYTSIALYHSTTVGAQPDPTNLVEGELALNIADGYLFYKRSGIVKNIAGLSGYSGISGYSGFSGISGYSGQDGGGGTSGISGYSGYSGTNGASGISGYSGRSGYSGATGPTVYPGSGIPLSTGAAWGTSFTSANPVTVNYGGTGLSGITTGQVPFGSTSTALSSSSNLFWDSGNTRLGVGLNNPVATLHVRGGNSNNAIIDNGGQQFTTLGFYNNGTAKAQTYWDQTNSLLVSGTDTTAAYVFKTNTTERMRISSSGGVSIGTPTDAGAGNLLISGSIKTANFSIVESGGKLYFYNGATAIASLDSSGNFTALGNTIAGGTP